MSLSWFILNPIHSFFSFAHGDEQGRLSKLFGAQWHFHLECSFPLVPLKTLNIQGWIPTIVLASAAAAAAAAESLQSSPTLCDPIDGSPPGSPVPGSLQARTLEWVTISFRSHPWASGFLTYWLSHCTFWFSVIIALQFLYTEKICTFFSFLLEVPCKFMYFWNLILTNNDPLLFYRSFQISFHDHLSLIFLFSLANLMALPFK